MNLGTIWWEQLGCSLRLLNHITNNLLDGRSAVLQTQGLPWRKTFFDGLNLRRSAFSADRRLVPLVWQGDSTPGECVLRSLCSQEVFARYWPGMTYARYMASLEDILLHDYDVWVSGIHTEEEICRWCEFVTDYAQCRKDATRRAVFILEYDGPPVTVSGVDWIPFRIEDHNSRVFCLEAASALGNTDLVDYQAELALSIGGRDIELCAALLEMGEALLLDPVAAAQDVIECDRDSLGREFAPMTPSQLTGAVWRASLVLLFPILEEFRRDFIARYRQNLQAHMPFPRDPAQGGYIREVEELELGHLWKMVSTKNCHIPPEDCQNVRRFRSVRHCIAHLKTVPVEDVQFVLSLR